MQKFSVAVTFLLGLGVAAKAETRPEIIAKFPFQFVVGGKTLPAGTYKVSRLGDDPLSVLMFTNDNRAAGVFVLPVSITEPSSDKPKVGFDGLGRATLLELIQQRGSRLQHLPCLIRSPWWLPLDSTAKLCFRKWRRPLDCRLLCYGRITRLLLVKHPSIHIYFTGGSCTMATTRGMRDRTKSGCQRISNLPVERLQKN